MYVCIVSDCFLLRKISFASRELIGEINPTPGRYIVSLFYFWIACVMNLG